MGCAGDGFAGGLSRPFRLQGFHPDGRVRLYAAFFRRMAGADIADFGIGLDPARDPEKTRFGRGIGRHAALSGSALGLFAPARVREDYFWIRCSRTALPLAMSVPTMSSDGTFGIKPPSSTCR